MTTIHDVARAAGVSSATVSHVINKSRFVRPQTRERVEDAIGRLRYRRDAIARSLRRARTATIGVMVADIADPFCAALVRGVEDAVFAADPGYSLIVCSTGGDPLRQRLSLEVLQEKRVEGLIAVAGEAGAEMLEAAAASGLPVVLAGREAEGAGHGLPPGESAARRPVATAMGRACADLLFRGIAGLGAPEPVRRLSAGETTALLSA